MKRFKRTLQFDNEPTDSKIKKKKQKMNKVFGSKLKGLKEKRGKISMQAVTDKLHMITNGHFKIRPWKKMTYVKMCIYNHLF